MTCSSQGPLVVGLVQDPVLIRAIGIPALAGHVTRARRQLAEDCMEIAPALGDPALGVQAVAMMLEVS